MIANSYCVVVEEGVGGKLELGERGFLALWAESCCSTALLKERLEVKQCCTMLLRCECVAGVGVRYGSSRNCDVGVGLLSLPSVVVRWPF